MNDDLVKKKNDDPSQSLFRDIKHLIESGRSKVAVTVNTALTLLYWQVGQRIHKEILGHDRAEYGKQILQTLAAKLTTAYGQGWSERNLAYMVKFAQVFSDPDILQALCAKLSWSHFKDLIYIQDPLKREFYAEMCRHESWSVRTLRKKIDVMLFERTALSKKPDEVIVHELRDLRETDKLSPDLVFRDPKSEIYQAWFNNGLSVVLDKKYLGTAITAAMTGMNIGIETYCDRFAPKGIMIGLSEKD